jgi:hypothetical protein
MRFTWNVDVMRGNLGDEKPAEGEAGVPERSEEEMEKRCAALKSSITFNVFNYIRRGLFESDKLLVSTLLCLKVRPRLVLRVVRARAFVAQSRCSRFRVALVVADSCPRRRAVVRRHEPAAASW